MRLQLGEPAVEESHERRHLERPRATLSFDRRQRRFRELDVTARTPGDHLAGPGVRQLLDRVRAHAPGHFDITGAQLRDAATMAGSAHHLVGDAERIHDIEGKQRDVRRLEHIAAGVKYEVRRLGAPPYPTPLLTPPLQPPP